MENSKQNPQEGKFVVFRLAEERYGVAISAVKEINVSQGMTRLPEMSDFVEGLINLRGRIIPIINLRKRFGLPAQNDQGASRTVVAELGSVEVGLLVDEVIGVVRVAGSCL